jgi:hypothetical protein
VGPSGEERRGGERPAGRSGLRALLLALGAVVLISAVLPYGSASRTLTVVGLLGGIALGIIAIVLGIRALARARRGTTGAPGAVMSIVTGSLATVFGMLLLLGIALLEREMSDLYTCQSRAITVSATAACEQAFEEAIRERAGLAP